MGEVLEHLDRRCPSDGIVGQRKAGDVGDEWLRGGHTLGHLLHLLEVEVDREHGPVAREALEREPGARPGVEERCAGGDVGGHEL